MDLITILQKDKELSDLLNDLSDMEILQELKTPQDEHGHVTYTISGKTFAKDGTGSEYILLDDGSIGYWGSEGSCGRIADNLKEFLEFMIYCPTWQDYLCENVYQDKASLLEFAKKIRKEHEEEAKEDEFDLLEAQKEIANRLGIENRMDMVEILMRFYHCAKREPRLIQTYREDDGSTHCGKGSLF